METNPLDTNQMDTNQQAVTSEQTSDWFITDTLRGEGSRPDWLEPKYKSIESQAKAYKEVRKQLGAMTGAPESYNLDNYKETLDIDNPHLKEFLGYARDNKLSQEAVDRTLKSFVDYASDFIPDERAEAEKIGPERLARVQSWAKNTLSEQALNALDRLPIREDIVGLLDELRTLKTEPSLPNALQAQSHAPRAATKAEILQELRDNYQKYETNPHYRQDLEARLASAVESGR